MLLYEVAVAWILRVPEKLLEENRINPLLLVFSQGGRCKRWGIDGSSFAMMVLLRSLQ
jgi:hypothetical protein